MFEVLAVNNIQIKMVSTSEIKVSAVVEEKNMLKAVEAFTKHLNWSPCKSEIECHGTMKNRLDNG